MSTIICEECRVGRYQNSTAPYTYRIDKQIVVYPDAPAFVCDVCKHRLYDAHFIHNVEYAIEQLMKRQHKRPAIKAKILPEGSSGWQPTR